MGFTFPQGFKLNFHRPNLYPLQEAAIFDPRRYSIIEASTKSGKTSGCIIWIFEEGLKARVGDNLWWVAPVSGQADIAFRRALRALPPHMFFANITQKTITLNHGPIIWFKSADHPDSLYGDDVKAAVVDEASRMKEDAWHAVRSTLTKTRGRVRIIGNVKGRRNWFYKIARRAESGVSPNMGFHKIVAADAVRAGVLMAEEIEDAKADLPEAVFRELYLAQPSDDQGNPFGFDHIRKCIGEMSDKEPRWWGWDLAKKQDWTVGIGLDENGRTCRFERFQGRPWDQTLELIRTLTGSTPALIDSSGLGDPILDMLKKTEDSNFEGYIFTAPSKQMLMEGLAVAIQSSQIKYPEGVISQELETFEYEYRQKSVRYSAPEGFHDDCVCALALAKYHMQTAEESTYDESLSGFADL